MVRGVNAEELIARLAVFSEFLGRDVEGARGECFVDRNINRADPGVVHADMSDQVGPLVDDGDVHRLADFRCFFFGGGDNAAGVGEFQHEGAPVCCGGV